MVIGTPTVLNLIPGGVMKVIHVNQVNENIEIQFRIMNGAQPFNVPEGVSCTIRGTKGDNFGYAADVAVTAGSNIVTVTLTEQLTAVAGAGNIFELVFVGASDDMKVSTENFLLDVERAALGEDTVISDSDLAYADQVLDQLQSVGAVNAQVQQNKANIAAEITRATAAEQTLQQNINVEAAARQAADNTLQSNINAEASSRATTDASLQSQINQLVAPSGEAPSAAEVQNARIGTDGTVYPTLGDAIRTQNSLLKSQLEASETIYSDGVPFVVSNDYAVSSDNGNLVSFAGLRYTVIDLTDKHYTTLTFKVSLFGANYGYGFVLADNSWSGVHTTETKDVTVSVPTGAKTFKLCWNPSSVSTQTISADVAYQVQTELKSALKSAEIYDDGAVDFTVLNDYAVSSTDGSLVSLAGMRYTIIDFSEKRYTSLTFKTSAYGGNYGYGFVLSNGTWSGVHTTTTETVTVAVPDNAKEFRLCWNPSSVSNQVISGIYYLKVEDRLDENAYQIESVKDKLKLNRQLDLDDVVNGYGISAETGELVELAPASYVIIDLTDKEYVSLTFSVTAFGANVGYGFILNDDSWSGVHTTANTTVTAAVPSGAKTFKLCWNRNNLAEQSISAVLYESMEDLWNVINSNVKEVYPLDISTSIGITSNAPVVVPAYNCNTDIYARYDALLAEFPDWIEKIDTSEADTEIGMSKPSYLNGLSIYMYKFSAKRTNITEKQKRLTVMITTATHPMEAMGIFNVFYFFKWINENWRTNDTALQLRTMVDFYVIPCVCPLGYNNILRTNRPVADGGVNINRNFPTKNWTLSGSGTADYSGASAGSEYETKIIMHYAETLMPDIYFDAHTGSMPNGRYGCMELTGNAKDYVVDTALSYAMGLVKDWIVNNTDFPQYIDGNPLFNVNVSDVYTGAAFRWFAENITDLAFLTEESIDNYWRNGVLTTSNPETGTERIFNENFKAVYGALVWFIFMASNTYKY